MSHTHVQFSAYDADRDEVIQRALAAGVRMVTLAPSGTPRAARWNLPNNTTASMPP